MQRAHLTRPLGRAVLTSATLAALAGAASAQVTFSIDSFGPLNGVPDAWSGVPITPSDILSPATGPAFTANPPALGAPIPPGVMVSGGFGPPAPGLGVPTQPGCIGAPPASLCPNEVDALSYGRDFGLKPNQPTPPGTFHWSVDQFAFGLAVPAAPNVASEGAAGPNFEGAADIFTDGGFIPGPIPPFAGPPSCTAVIDGNGLPNAMGVVYPGLGVVEPALPGLPPNTGDNVDAVDVDFPAAVSAVFPIYYSVDSPFPDPCYGFPNTGTGPIIGFSGADVLVTMGPGAGPVMYAPAPALGLDFAGFSSDDLDALALMENGDGVYTPSMMPYDWIGGATDMLLFSVRRGSMIIGAIDSILGIPIEEGDILTTPLGGIGAPGIFIAAENLGLATVRSGVPSNCGDDLDALDVIDASFADCNGNGIPDSVEIAGGASDINGNGVPDDCELFATSYCFCAAGAPCGNTYAPGGCRNSTGVGGLLTASGTSSIANDDLILTSSQLPTGQFSIMFMGPGTIPPVFMGDGLRCTGGPIYRYPIAPTGAAGMKVQGPGIVAYANGTFPAAGNIFAGSTWSFQDWYRDPLGPCGSTYSVTHAVGITFTP